MTTLGRPPWERVHEPAAATTEPERRRSPGARAGWAMVGFLAVVLTTVAVVAFLAYRPHGRAVEFTALRAGDCFNREAVDDGLVSVRVVPCTSSHRHEAFAVIRIPVGPGVAFPGRATMRIVASAACQEPLSEYLGGAPLPPDVQFGFLYPEEQRWDKGERLIVCDLFATGGGARRKSVRSA